MLQLRTAKGDLVLDSKTRIRFSNVHPMFVTDGISNSVSYAFDLPDDSAGINRGIIGTYPYFDSARKYRKIGITCIFGGDEFDAGLLFSTGSSNGTFRCIFYSTPFIEGFDDKQIQDFKNLLTPIELGDTPAEIIAEAKSLSQNQYPYTDVVFPSIYAPDFYGDKNKDFAGILNKIVNGEYQINEITKEWEAGDPEEGDYETNENSLIPAFFQRSILRDIFKSQGYKVIGNYFTNPKTRNAVMLGLKAADRFDYKWWLDANITGYIDYDGTIRFTSNDYSNGSGISFNGQLAGISQVGYVEVAIDDLVIQYYEGSRNVNISILVGDGTLRETLTVNGTTDIVSGLTLFMRFWNYDGYSSFVSIVCGPNYRPISGKITIRGVSQNNWNRFAKSVSIGEYFNGIDVSTMVNAIRQMWGLLLFIDKQRSIVQVELAKDVIQNSFTVDITKWVISGPEIDFTDRKKYTVDYDWNDAELMTPLNKRNIQEYSAATRLPLPLKDSVVKILNLYRFLTTEENEDGTYRWKEDVTFISKVVTPGIEAEDYKPPLQSLVSHNQLTDLLKFSSTVFPYLPGEGKSDAFGNDNEIKLTVLNYFGFVNGYPFASISNVDGDGTKHSDIQSLRMDGDDGLYKNVLKPLLNLVGNHQTITLDIFPSMESVNAILKVFKPQMEGEEQPPRKVMVMGVDLWVKQFDFEITNNAIVSAQVKLAKPEYEH